MASIAMGVMGALGAAGSIGSSIIGSNAESNAVSTEEQAAQSVIGQEQGAATAATGDVNAATGTANTGLSTGLASGNQTIANALTSQQAALSPYIAAGTSSLANVQSELSGLTAPSAQFNFEPATSPQLQFEQEQANQALQRQAAASGTVLGGGTVRASDIMNTGLASTYLNQAFNQSLAQYNTNRQNTLTQLQGNTNLAGLGYNATGALNSDIGTAGLTTNSNIQNVAGKQAANTIAAGTYAGNTGLTAAQIEEQATLGAANASAQGSLAQGNIWGGLTSSLAGSAGSLYGLSQGPSWGGGGGPSSPVSSGSMSPGGTYGMTPGTDFTPNYGSDLDGYV